MNKWLAEAVGTFALVFAGTGAIIVDEVSDGVVSHVGISLIFGLIVMAMIYSIGDVSGAHINPAVTLGFWICRRIPAAEVLPYVVSQLLGAILASVLLKLLFYDHPSSLGSTLPAGVWWQSFVLEIVLTFILMFVILGVSTGAKEKGVMAGIAIGGTVALLAMLGGPICGASMNPARSIGPAVASGTWQHLWIYIVAPVAGAALAIPVYRIIHSESEFS